MVLSDGTPPPPSPATTTPAPLVAPVLAPTPTLDEPVPQDVGTQGTTITTTTSFFDPRSSADNGCDPDGCTGELTRVSKLEVKVAVCCVPVSNRDG